MSKRKSSSSSSSSKPKLNYHNTPFQIPHALEYGLKITQRDPNTSTVLGVHCNFCAFFGHELLDGHERSRKQTQNVKSWTSFRPEYYRNHHEGQHSTRWKEYQELSNEAKEQYFKEKCVCVRSIFILRHRGERL
jgi:hypothetical protein